MVPFIIVVIIICVQSVLHTAMSHGLIGVLDFSPV